MTLPFYHYLLKRRDRLTGRLNRFGDIRHRLQQQTRDYSVRGKGNRAYKRLDALLRAQQSVTVNPIDMARQIMSTPAHNAFPKGRWT